MEKWDPGIYGWCARGPENGRPFNSADGSIFPAPPTFKWPLTCERCHQRGEAPPPEREGGNFDGIRRTQDGWALYLAAMAGALMKTGRNYLGVPNFKGWSGRNF